MSTTVPYWRRVALRPGISHEGVLLAVLILEIVALSWLSPYFLTFSNLLGASQFFVETGLVALGMTLVIMTGGIDLSVGGGLALASVTLGFSYQAGLPLWLAIVFAIVVATAGGLLNGFLTTRWRIHPLAITLATGELFRGIASAVSDERAVSTFPAWFNVFGQGQLGVIPNQLWVFLAAAVVIGVLLVRGRFGRQVQATGISEEAARASGIPTRKVKTLVYLLTGLLVGLAAVIYTSRVSTARSDAGTGLELEVIAAVVLGGASIFGGTGTILGTVLGVLIIAFLQQGLLLMPDLDSNWILVITGGVMLVAVFFNEFFRRRE
jgi:rhamnose transport system permease protein